MTPQVLGTKQVAERAGVSIWTVHDWVRRGKLPVHTQIGGKHGQYLFDPDTVDAFLAERQTDGEVAS